eukprot:707092-Amphidinium_carterae.2
MLRNEFGEALQSLESCWTAGTCAKKIKRDTYTNNQQRRYTCACAESPGEVKLCTADQRHENEIEQQPAAEKRSADNVAKHSRNVSTNREENS